MCTVGVQAILNHIEIERAHIDGAKLLGCLRDPLKLVHIVSSCRFFDQLGQSMQCILIDLEEIGVGYGIVLDIEVVKIAEAKPQGIAKLPISAGYLVNDFIAKTNICDVVSRTNL